MRSSEYREGADAVAFEDGLGRVGRRDDEVAAVS